MNSGFVNRLVGTTIVVIAAIIFIPNIIDGQKLHFKEGFKTIPERPEFDTVEIDYQSQQENLAKQLPQSTTVVVDELPVDAEPELVEVVESAEQVVQTQPEATKKTPPVVDKRPETSNLTRSAYVVQLGSFSHQANVKTLLAKLKKAGFDSFTKPIQTPSGKLTKVFVGPEINKTKLEKKLPQLKKLTGLKGKITTFNVTE